MPTAPLRVLIMHAHPFTRRSRVNQAFRKAVEGIEGVKIHDLYEMYPDFLIDVEHEQKALLEADVVLFQHPMYWYSCPSLMKEWIDSVLERGWAYGGGTALAGKYWIQVISAGAPEASYGRQGGATFSTYELLRPFEQTAYLCKMTPLRPMITHSARTITEPDIAARAREYRALVEGLVQGKLPSPYSTTHAPEVR